MKSLPSLWQCLCYRRHGAGKGLRALSRSPCMALPELLAHGAGTRAAAQSFTSLVLLLRVADCWFALL